ncbi:MAG TPA: Ig-like domain-containing protein [Planctomycetota bacterium]|nr:Ig-like domain-containing protein [Planctomycetota bacterium]
MRSSATLATAVIFGLILALPTAMAAAPVANNQSATLVQNSSRTGISLSYSASGTLAFTLVTKPAHGTLEYYGSGYQALAAGQTVSTGYWYYTPVAGYVGADSFVWKIGDGTATSANATCTITVKANSAPVASAQSLTTTQGSSRAGISLSYTHADSGQTLAFTLVTAPAHGTLEYYGSAYQALAAGQTAANGSWYFTPAAGYTGTDSFVWKVSDGLAASADATCTVTINANSAPVARAQSVSLLHDTPQAPVALSYTHSDANQPLTYTLVTAPAHGVLKYYNSGLVTLPTGMPVSANYWYYIPAAGYVGADSFVWKMSDGLASSANATCSLTVKANTAPVANEQNLATVRDTAANFPASFTDPDAQAFTLTVVTPPAHGTLTASGGNFAYVPAAGYTGTDSFAWKVSDGEASSAVATCRLLVRAVNSRAGMTVLLVVNDLLYPEIRAEVDRLKADLEREGYAAKIKTLPASTTTTALWNYLQAEYRTPGQFVSGAILIGNLPKGAYNTSTNEQTDCTLWNMDGPLGDVSRRHIWVSRIWATDGAGAQAFAGGETTLIRRALDANHSTRTGAQRLPHTAYYYEIFNGATYMNSLLSVWPAAEYLEPHLGWVKGGDVIHETSHGGPSAYGSHSYMNVINIHNLIAQARFGLITSCVSGAYGGVVNNQIFTRGGGNIFSVGAEYTTYDGAFEMTGITGLQQRLAAGDTWGNSLVQHPFWDTYRAVYYGDLSLPVKPAPANQMPVVSTLTANQTAGPAPLTVSFSAAASDPDGSVARWEWFPAGHYYGKVEPSASGAAATSASHTYALPHRYLARVQVEDNFKAIAYKEVEIRVAPQPGQPLRINCGRVLSTSYASAYYSPASDYVDSQGRLWLHDQVYAAGTWGTNGLNANVGAFAGDVLGTTDDNLYLYYTGDYYRSGFTYTIPLANGGYTLKLGFADMRNTAAGKRLLDVTLNGTPALTGFDIVGTFGAKTAGTVTRHVDVTTGSLAIFVKTSATSPTGTDGMAILNCLELIPDGGANSPPVAANQSIATNEDTAKAITLSATDPEGGALGYQIVAAPAHGTLAGVAPNVTYTPVANWNGTDSFTFRANDGLADSNIATVTVTVAPVNDAPVATAQSVNATAGVAKAISLAATDVEGSALTYAVVAAPAHGTLSGTAPDLTYTAAAGYSGADSFTFKASDGGLDSNVATVTISVAPPTNRAPVAANQSITTPEDASRPVALSATDADGDALTFAIVAAPAHGTLTGTAPNVTYVPAADYSGADSFTFRASDGKATSNVATVTVTVTPVNDPPLIDSAMPAEATLTINVGDAVTFEVYASDPDGNALSYAWTRAGAAAGGNSASYTFTGTAADVGGTRTVAVTVADGKGGTAVWSWQVAVLPVNRAPVAANQAVSTNEDTARAIVLSATDADGNPLTYAIVAGPDHGTLSGTGANRTYLPAANWSGTDTFTFKAHDGTADSNVATVTVTVAAVNDPPTVGLTAPAAGTTYAYPATVAMTATAADVDGTVAKVEFYQGSTLLATDTASPYAFNWTGTGVGTYTLTARAYDNSGAATTSASITVKVLPTVTLSVYDGWAAEPGTDTARFLVSRTGATTDALTVTYTVGGTATNGVDCQQLTGSLDIPTGSASAYITVTPIDEALAESRETLTVTLSAGAAYKLGSATSGSINLLDNETPAVTLSVTDAWASESGPDTGRITVNRTGSTAAAMTVNYTLGGTATNGTDYAALSGSVVIPAGAASSTVEIAPLNDTLVEARETVTLAIADGAGYQVGYYSSCTIYILDDEVPAINVSATDSAAAETGGDIGTFTITRSGKLDVGVTVYYTMSGSATKGTDYAAPSGSVLIPAGQTTATVTVAPVNDTLVEGREYAQINLTANAAYQTGWGTYGVIYIYDDEKPEVKVATTVTYAYEQGLVPGQFTVSCQPAAKTNLAVSLVLGGSAQAGADFAAIPATVTIPAGKTSAVVLVTPIDDLLAESTESVTLTLVASGAYSNGSPASATVYVMDNEPTVYVSATDASAAETAAGATANPGRFRITRYGGTTAPALSVTYSLGGTATNGTDYARLTGTATIPAGAAYADVVLTPTDDASSEGPEAAVLTLSAGSGYRLSTSSATVTISDND